MRAIFAVLVVALVILGHVGLWSSDAVPAELKADLTRINALAWAVVLLPAGAVALWLRAHRRRPRRDGASRKEPRGPHA